RGLAPLWSAGLLLALIGLAALGWQRLRRKGVPALYRRLFPAIYWIVALGFGAIHALNYAHPTWLTALLVLPQVWAGVMLGFTRQRLGLGASMLEHAGANAAVMALALIPSL
ncbi:CPBP family intramembrane metalloprotease, partial [Novosphingobium sp. 1949]|nr:CPBP family intramembrane metalloprotease [Novosphingobium organovorum]